MKTIDFSEADDKQIKASVAAIRRVPRKHDADITSIVGLVTADEIKETESAVEVRFSEESVLNVQMNMVAFD